MKMKFAILLLLLMSLMACRNRGGSEANDPAENPAPTSAVDNSGAAEESAAGDSTTATGDSAALEPLSALPAPVDLRDAPAAVIADTSGYYRLQTQQGAADGTCLEGNRLADDAFLQGAAFMSRCEAVTSQLWKLSPAEPEGTYRLQTLHLEAQDKCLEGNRLADESTLGGAAFMSDCSNATGQSWKFVEAGDGAYRLQTTFLAADNKCLQGNQLGQASLLRGASFMDDCLDVGGQVWTLIPVTDSAAAVEREIVDLQSATAATLDFAAANAVLPGGTSDAAPVYYRLQTTDPDGTPRCLDGNVVADGAVLDGASFADECQNVPGQQWLIIPTSLEGQYTLLPNSLEGSFKCFDGNQIGPDAALGGVAFMNECARDPGQQWLFVAAADGAYRLQTGRHGELNMCLDANLGTGTLPAAASMSACDQSADQLWTLAPVSP
jgi:hypothetical protein